MDSKKIGKTLRELRGNKSIKEIAEAVGVGESTICMYESGARVPKDEIKIKLAKYFNESIEKIFFAE